MKSRRPARRHAQVHLPPLDAGYALTLVNIFERAIEALWRAHGDRMAQLLQQREQAARAARHHVVFDGDPDAPDDIPFRPRRHRALCLPLAPGRATTARP
jgi:hypothetical protein